mmetsp:Transcript_5903/g.11164  ORF Transcript_5903/g.11164 Transcript_5903/m.11164 type:complete len:446 (+) Transcript_5903:2234-3571(+)
MASEFQIQREVALNRRREYFLQNSNERRNDVCYTSLAMKPRPFTPKIHNLNESRARELSFPLGGNADLPLSPMNPPSKESKDGSSASVLSSCVSGNIQNRMSKSSTISNSPNFSKGRVLQKQTTTSGTLGTAFSYLSDCEDAEGGSQFHVATSMMDSHNKLKVEQESNKDYIKYWSEKIDWDSIKEVKDYLLKPVPKLAGMVQCYIRRSRKDSRLFPEYRIYLQEGDQFLMSSKKRKKRTSNYLISTKRSDHNKGSDNIIGKLRSNFLGTEYQIFDEGKSPKAFDPFFDEKNEDAYRNELGAVLYGNNMTNTKGPRRMNVCINKVDENDEATKIWQPYRRDDNSMLNSFKQNSDSVTNHLLYFENRQPKRNEDMCAYMLNFKKRVTMASVKNFQLMDKSDDTDRVIIQFGRTGNDDFIMDVRWPMSLFQAFAISLSSCDSKIACD